MTLWSVASLEADKDRSFRVRRVDEKRSDETASDATGLASVECEGRATDFADGSVTVTENSSVRVLIRRDGCETNAEVERSRSIAWFIPRLKRMIRRNNRRGRDAPANRSSVPARTGRPGVALVRHVAPVRVAAVRRLSARVVVA